MQPAVLIDQYLILKSAKHINLATQVCSLEQLPRDMRRMLKVQWKEFIHHLEDSEMMGNSHNEPSICKCE